MRIVLLSFAFLLSAAISLAPQLVFASADDNTREMAGALMRMGENIGGEMGIGSGLAWGGFWIGLGIALAAIIARER